MQIMRFFTVFTLFFVIELMMLALVQHPSVPFVHLIALSALVAGDIPWYAQAYLLIGISLSAFVQGFCIVTNLIGFSCLAIARLCFGDIILNTIIIQSVVVLSIATFFMGLNCPACFTVVNCCIAVLFVPCMIRCLGEA